MSIVISGAIFVALAIATVAISKIMDEPITWALARLLGGIGPRQRIGVRGTWKSVYSYYGYQNGSGRKTVEQIVLMRQFGPYVTGKAIAASGGHKHRIRGQFRGRVLTGTWENITEGAEHHGALQLLLHPDGKAMAGQWIGFDQRNRVQHGEWNWELLNRSTDKTFTGEALEHSEGS